MRILGKYLVENGANINYKDSIRKTALIYAYFRKIFSRKWCKY